jgi:hypothetical protein
MSAADGIPYYCRMNNGQKVVAGTSAGAGLLLLFHILHLAHSAKMVFEEKPEDRFKNAPMIFLVRDSTTGKMDTLSFDEYMKLEKQDSLKRKSQNQDKARAVK